MKIQRKDWPTPKTPDNFQQETSIQNFKNGDTVDCDKLDACVQPVVSRYLEGNQSLVDSSGTNLSSAVTSLGQMKGIDSINQFLKGFPNSLADENNVVAMVDTDIYSGIETNC